MRDTKRTLQEVLKAIENTGGIKSQIADNLMVDRHTVVGYLDRWVTAENAWADECKRNRDNAEHVITKNIRLAKEKQDDGDKIVDSKDAKWYLSKTYKEKYSDRVEHAGVEDKPIVVEMVAIGGINPEKDI